MNGIEGKLIGVQVDGKYITCETSCEFNMDREFVDVAPIISGKFKERLPRLMDWTVSLDANLMLVAAGNQNAPLLLNKMIAGESVALTFGLRTGIDPEFKLTGNAYIQNFRITAPSVGVGTWNTTFIANGPIEVTYDQYYLIIDAMPAPADKPYIVDTRNW